MKMLIKINLKTELIPLLFVVGAIILSIVSFPNLPDKVASHWNFQGLADGYSSKMFHAIFFPAILLALYLLFLFLPLLDPKKENYTKFAASYQTIKSLIIGVFFFIFALATLTNLGYQINIGKSVAAIIGLMMIALGVAMRKLKDNWFVGIRTPWTMSSPKVWDKTHLVGTYGFVVFGIIIIIAPYLPAMLAGILFVVGALVAILVPVVYSYLIYRQEKNK